MESRTGYMLMCLLPTAVTAGCLAIMAHIESGTIPYRLVGIVGITLGIAGFTLTTWGIFKEYRGDFGDPFE